MRNFSAVVPSNKLFVTYNGNARHQSSRDEVFGNVIKALAAAFESPVVKVREALNLYLTIGADAYTHLAPSEESVVFRLADFFLEIVSEEDSQSGGSSRAFCYHNLNNGRSVVWSHIVIGNGEVLL